MQLAGTSTEYLYVPVYGPPGVDLTQYPVAIALAPDDGTEPVSGWLAATWDAGRARTLIMGGQVPPGQYMAWVKITATPEVPVLRSGRVRVGDTRG